MAEYTAVIEPFYPKAGNGRALSAGDHASIHCMQHWYNLSDGAMEDALYEIASMRLFARLSLDSALPDRTTIMNFRHLLEQHQLAIVQDHQSLAGRSRRHDDPRHFGGCHHH
jgi:IS5 family transposase